MPTRRAILLRLSIALAVLYLFGTVFGAIGLGEIALHPASRPIHQSEERNAEATAERNSVEFHNVELVTQDGAFLRAWFMRPQEANGNAVILLHGVSDNRLGMYGYGRWLLQNHYSVLLPDAREEANDIHQWVDWIEINEHPHCGELRLARRRRANVAFAIPALTTTSPLRVVITPITAYNIKCLLFQAVSHYAKSQKMALFGAVVTKDVMKFDWLSDDPHCRGRIGDRRSQINHPIRMDHLEVLREKVNRLREEIAEIQHLNNRTQLYGRNDPKGQLAQIKRQERLQAIQRELVQLASLGPKIHSMQAMKEKHRCRLNLKKAS